MLGARSLIALVNFARMLAAVHACEARRSLELLDLDAHHGAARRSSAALQIDQLSMLMTMIVTGRGSSIIHVYSVGYMRDDPGYATLLRVPKPVHLLHAGPRPGRELPADVRRLGRRRVLLVPADRVLVSDTGKGRTRARRRSSSIGSATSAS